MIDIESLYLQVLANDYIHPETAVRCLEILRAVARTVYSTDSYWDVDVKEAYADIERLIKSNIEVIISEDENLDEKTD